MSEFVAVDGEAAEDESYVLLAASTGASVWSDDGLPTARCFEFLLALSKPKRRLVCYGLNYDVNQWLSSLPLPTLRELWSTGWCVWRHYQIKWLPGRWFSVRRDQRHVKITEVLGFFQSSLVAALEAWGIEAQAELKWMKGRRGSFSRAERKRVEAYCLQECRDLVTLMGALERATIEAECVPHDWIGAGALAGAMLKARGLAAHHAHDEQIATEPAREAIMRAYFGGRVEALRLGSHYSISAMDVRSAYPWAATYLPTLAGARLALRRRFDPSVEHGVWRVRWSGQRGPLMPFPVRHRRCIYYPRSGEGFYHACEVRAALAAGFELQVGGGYTLTGRRRGPIPRDASGPFTWVPEAFALRARWKREGNAAERALKLGLNSIYGKLAQGIGYSGGPPRWQSYFWAGEITARTRARMLTASLGAHEPLAIATDGIFARDANGHRPSAELGGWELSRYEALFIAQAGLYGAEAGGEFVLRSRGHFARELDYTELREGFEREGYLYTYRYQSRRFVGLGSALMLRDMRKWRSWPPESRQVSLYPMRKLPGEEGRLEPPSGRELSLSEPYVPKSKLYDTAELSNVQAAEQPMRNTM